MVVCKYLLNTIPSSHLLLLSRDSSHSVLDNLQNVLDVTFPPPNLDREEVMLQSVSLLLCNFLFFHLADDVQWYISPPLSVFMWHRKTSLSV